MSDPSFTTLGLDYEPSTPDPHDAGSRTDGGGTAIGGVGSTSQAPVKGV
jgi:hypothetical protein